MNTYDRGVNDSHNRVPRAGALVTLLIAVLLLLAACGGAAETAPSITEEDTAAVVEPTVELTETEEPATADIVASDVPATSEPDPTAPPEPTTEPTPEPAGLSLPDGLCANPYFPVVDGTTYTYQTEIPDFGPSTYSFTFANVTPVSFDMILGDAEADYVTYTWQCLEDGLLSPNLQFNTGGPDITIETIESSGVTFPSPDNVEVGHTWNSRYVFSTDMGAVGLGDMQMSQTIELVNEIVAIEPITTAYGTFDEAVKVASTGVIEITTTMEGTALPAMTIDMSSTTWYVEGIGRVRSEELSDMMGTGEMTPTITELISIE